jgi:hypothetical protein
MKYRTLKTSTDIMKLLQFATNAVLKGDITESMAKTLTYTASTANQVIKTHEIEKRLDELEDKINEVKE